MFTNLSKMRQIWQKINKSKYLRPLQIIRDTLMGGGEGGRALRSELLSEISSRLVPTLNISKIQKTAISETRENKNFRKKRLTQGLRRGVNKVLQKLF